MQDIKRSGVRKRASSEQDDAVTASGPAVTAQPGEQPATRIVIAEADNEIAERLAQRLTPHSNRYSLHRVLSAEALAGAIDAGTADIVLLGYGFIGREKIPSLRAMLRLCRDVPAILVEAEANAEMLVSGLREGLQDCLIRDLYDGATLHKSIEGALKRTTRLRASDLEISRLRDFAEISSDFIWEMGPDHRFTYISDRYFEITGLSRNEVVGLTPHELHALSPQRILPVNGWNDHRELLQTFDEQRAFRNAHILIEAPGGETSVVDISGKPIFDDSDGSFAGYRGVGSDATDRWLTERKLQESEARFRDFSEVSGDWLWESDETHRITFLSESFSRVTGMRRQSYVGKPRWDAVLPVDSGHVAAHKAELERFAEFRDFEFATVDSTGARRTFLLSGRPTFDHRGTFAGYRGSGRDVTRRNETQVRLRTLSQALDQAPVSVVITDDDGKIEYVNQYAAETAGMQCLADTSSHRRLLHTGLAEDGDFAALMQHLKDGKTWRGEFENSLSDGTRYWEAAVIAPIRDDDGITTNFISVKANVTERKKAQLMFAAQAETLKALLETLPQGVSMIDADLNVVAVNKSFLQILDLPAALFEKEDGPTTFADVIRYNAERGDYGECDVEEKVAEMVERARRLQPHRFERTRPDGTVIEIIGEPLPHGGFVTSYMDITERRRAEQETRQTLKMESLGTLAGGLAHEVNNTLIPVISLSEMLVEKFSEDSDEREIAQAIFSSGERIHELVEQILEFSRQDDMKPERIDLNVSLEDMVRAMRTSMPSNVSIEADLRDVPEIEFNRVQLKRVLLNLATNAAHAIGDDPGSITFSLAVAAHDPAKLSTTPEIPAGNYVAIGISDTGCGMSAETIERIFDPFFTTKPVGEGTGMGLSAIHGVVAKQGGGIHVASQPDHGSTFTLLLPQAESASRS